MASSLILLSLLLLCAPLAFAQSYCNVHPDTLTCNANATSIVRVNQTALCADSLGPGYSAFRAWINPTEKNFYFNLYANPPENATNDACATSLTAGGMSFIYSALTTCQSILLSFGANTFRFSFNCSASIGAVAPTASVNQSLSLLSGNCSSDASMIFSGAGFQCMRSAAPDNSKFMIAKWSCGTPSVSYGAAKSSSGCDMAYTNFTSVLNGTFSGRSCLKANDSYVLSTKCVVITSAAFPAYSFGLALILLLAAVLLL